MVARVFSENDTIKAHYDAVKYISLVVIMYIVVCRYLCMIRILLTGDFLCLRH